MNRVKMSLTLTALLLLNGTAWARQYDPEIGRFLQEDPVFQPGQSAFLYANNNPVIFTDPLGLDAIYVNFDYYPISVGGGVRLPLGHAGVVAVDPGTGMTRYFEYGRYDAANRGMVRSRPVPNLNIGANGLPTQASLDNLYGYLSTQYGRGSNVTAIYYPDSSYRGTIGFALSYMNDRHRPRYDLLNNNCKTFAGNAATACLENQSCPWAP